MLEGLWTVEFESRTGMRGTGVAILINGKILGGDDQYYYVGEYRLSGNSLTAAIEATAFVPNAVDIFGRPSSRLTLLIGGLVRDNEILAQSVDPAVSFVARMVKRKSLP